MQKNTKDKFGNKSFKRFVKSFKYCYEGIRYAFYHEQNIFVMIVVGIIALILGIILNISYGERLVIALLVAITLSLEMVNTAIEANVNLVTKEKKEDAKHAKDAAAGAVGIFCVFDVIIGLMIFIPKIVLLFK